MIGTRPDWLLDSPYFFYNDEGEWDVKEDAPEDFKKKFKEYMERTSHS